MVRLLIPLLLTGCCTTTTVAYDGPCPARPALEPVSTELQIEMPPQAVRIVSDNQMKLKRHIKDLEVLSGCEKPAN